MLMLMATGCAPQPGTKARQDKLAGLLAAPQLHVSGKRIVNQYGHAVVLHGVDRSGGEYKCVEANEIWSGPMNRASINAMKYWGVTAVRIPLNEACWNGEKYVNPADAGVNYRNAVEAYVSLLDRHGIVAILDLHWTDGAYTGPHSQCASAEALCQKPMPDAAHAVPFWRSVARTFSGNNSVIFDLFNEPYPNYAAGSAAAGWACWKLGGTCPGISYQVAGMQTLVDTVRRTGATNVLMLGGVRFANDLTGWLRYEPRDPDHNLVASWHSYSFNTCARLACWKSQIAPVIAKVPVITGEMGETDCTDRYVGPLTKWLDSKHSGYLAWGWNTWACYKPGLITSYEGSPTRYGAGYLKHIAWLDLGLIRHKHPRPASS
jgi:endoglucanase